MVQASCFERLLSQRVFLLASSEVNANVTPLCWAVSISIRMWRLNQAGNTRMSPGSCSLSWLSKMISSEGFRQDTCSSRNSRSLAHSHSQSQTISCALCCDTCTHPHTSWSRPAIPSSFASWLESRAFCGSTTRVDMDAIFKL